MQFFSQLGIMALPLCLCAVITLAIFLERLVFYIRNRKQKRKIYADLSTYLKRYRNEKKVLRDEMIEVMLSKLQKPYYSGIRVLRIVGTISPMLGLLGTILGIISAFKVISIQAGAVSPNMIAAGLWEALLTTAFGLFIGLPALLMAHLFTCLSDNQLENFCLSLNELSISFDISQVKND